MHYESASRREGLQSHVAAGKPEVEALAAEVLRDPRAAAPYRRLGQALMDRGMTPEALAALEAAYALDPAFSWFQLAEAYERDRQYFKAFQIWRNRVEMLAALRPDEGFVDNPHCEFAERSRLRSEFDATRRRIQRCRIHGDARHALRECKLAVAQWCRAFIVRGEALREQEIYVGEAAAFGG
jgi:tetratricopeptide (TPR) repeat protein